MKMGRKNTDITLAGTNEMQTRHIFSEELKRRDAGKEFSRELKRSGVVVVRSKKKTLKTIRKVKMGTVEIHRVVLGKRKRLNRLKTGKRAVLHDQKSQMLILKQNESARLERNLHHLADQKKTLEKAMQNYVEQGKIEHCQKMIEQIDLRIERNHIKRKALNTDIMILRADRYMNGYNVVRQDTVRNKIYITHKQFLTLSKTRKISEQKYKRIIEREKESQILSEEIKNNTKKFSGTVVKGSIKEATRGGKERLIGELEEQGDTGSEAVKLMVESPGRMLEGAKTLKHGAGAMIRAPGRIGKGTWNTGKNAYKTGKAAVRGAKATAKTMLKAKQWAVAFAKSKQKAIMLKQVMEQATRALAEAAKAVIHVAVKIIMFIIQGLASIGLPVIIIAALIGGLIAIVCAIMATVLSPYLDNKTMEITKALCTDYLGDYKQWTEVYKESFMESNCYMDCDYDNNDMVSIQFMSDGYQTMADNRALIVYVAAYAQFEDISIVGESPDSQDAEKILNFMTACLEFLNPQDEAFITGTDQRFKEYVCKKEKDSDGVYHHEHDYGEWRLKFRLRTENELLHFLGFDTVQLETYHSMMSEFSRQVQEETSHEVAMKGFSLTDYFDFFGGNQTSGEVLADLIDLGDVELTEVTAFSLQYVGNPYVWGGNSLTDGVDCSGFVKAIYEHFGVTGIPRTSSEQSQTGELVSGLDEAKPGDLIFYGQPVHHVALYLGGGQIVHASNSKPYPAGGIKVSSATYATITCIRRWVDDS